MYLRIICKRSVRISTIQRRQQNSILNSEMRDLEQNISPYPNSLSIHPTLYQENQQMEFSRLQETLKEIWEEWNAHGSELGEAEVDESLIAPVKNALIFRFVAKRSIGIKDLENALNVIWKPNVPAIISMVGEGVYIAAFENIGDCNKVVAKQPWQLNGSLLAFRKAQGDENIEELRINEVPFWIQIHGLQVQLRTRYVGELIGNRVGRVLEVDGPVNALTWCRCLRVRVLINVNNRLMRGSKVKFGGVSQYVLFRYEKLGDFCFVCGKLDHVEKECPVVFATEGGMGSLKKLYGPWLRADGMKGATVEEVGRGFGIRGQVGEGTSREVEDRAEQVAAEEFAMQVMQIEPMQDQNLGERQVDQGVRGDFMVDNRSAGGLECVVQGVNIGSGQLRSTFNTSPITSMQMIEFNKEGIFNTFSDPLYQLNATKEWTNVNFWGPSVPMMDAGASNFQANQQLQIMDQNVGLNMSQMRGEMAVSTQSSNKVKGRAVVSGREKGKGTTGAGRGKAKITATGHKAAKRGNRSGDEGIVGAKKMKKTDDGSSEMVIYGELKGLDITIMEGEQKGPTLEVNVENNRIEDKGLEAEAGESQPRLEP